MKRFARLQAIGDLCVPDSRDPLFTTESTARRRWLGRAELPLPEQEKLAKDAGLVDAKGHPLVGHLPLPVRFPALPHVDIELTRHVRKLCREGKAQMRLLAECEAATLKDAKALLDAKTTAAKAAPIAPKGATKKGDS